eukprot:SAG31_NODE_1422_length_8420_cov_2.887514_3_plen_110_part_00
MEACDRALDLDRSNLKAAARRGTALSMQGRHEEAVLWMMELVERHPDDEQLAEKLLGVQLAAGVFDEDSGPSAVERGATDAGGHADDDDRRASGGAGTNKKKKKKKKKR